MCIFSFIKLQIPDRYVPKHNLIKGNIQTISICTYFQEFCSDEYTFFHAFEAKTFWLKSLGFPYDHDESEPIGKTKKWLLKEQDRYLGSVAFLSNFDKVLALSKCTLLKYKNEANPVAWIS